MGKAELLRRHGRERLDKDLESVQHLEALLHVVDRWTITSPRWASTMQKIQQRKYQLALDSLELLIVERIFELTKMDQFQTGPFTVAFT